MRSRSTPSRSLSRRGFALGVFGSLELLLAGCVSTRTEGSGNPSRQPTTTTSDGSSHVSIHVASPTCAVAVGQSLTIAVQARHIGRLQWQAASLPEQWNEGGTVIGDVQFAPNVSRVAKSLPPIYMWDPPAETLTGTIDIHVPDTASPGTYALTLIASNSGGQETGTAVINVTDSTQTCQNES